MSEKGKIRSFPDKNKKRRQPENEEIDITLMNASSRASGDVTAEGIQTGERRMPSYTGLRQKRNVSDWAVEFEPSENDPEGSYTGRPLNAADTPVQDADDL